MKKSLRFVVLLFIAIAAVSVYDAKANGSRNIGRLFSSIEALLDSADRKSVV